MPPLKLNEDGSFPMRRDDWGRWQPTPEAETALEGGEAGVHTHSEYAASDHAHAGGDHPDLATHTSLGLAAAHAHDFAASGHSHFLGHTHSYASNTHTHAQSDVTNLTTDLSGKAASGHNHDAAYSATGHTHSHNHDGTYATAVHAHAAPVLTDQDIPSSIARDTEVSAAITAHLSAATHGGEGGSIPAGLIVMWGGLVSAIPTGWALCDGQNGTPDLRDRFIRGAAAGQDPGGTGGAATHSHSFTQPDAHTDVINHTHTVSVTDPGHTHVQQRFPTATGGSTGFTVDTSMSGTPAAANATASSTTGITASTANPAGAVASLTHTGGAVADGSTLPPYYALCFIQKT